MIHDDVVLIKRFQTEHETKVSKSTTTMTMTKRLSETVSNLSVEGVESRIGSSQQPLLFLLQSSLT